MAAVRSRRSKGARQSKYPFSDLDVGESCMVYANLGETIQYLHARVDNAARYHLGNGNYRTARRQTADCVVITRTQ